MMMMMLIVILQTGNHELWSQVRSQEASKQSRGLNDPHVMSATSASTFCRVRTALRTDTMMMMMMVMMIIIVILQTGNHELWSQVLSHEAFRESSGLNDPRVMSATSASTSCRGYEQRSEQTRR
jgi:HD superfamily phosphohydrolase YqeK